MASPLLKKRRIRNRKIAVLTSALLATAFVFYFKANFIKTDQYTSELSGREWMDELLIGHPARMRDNLGISQEGF
jgi:hypothetical protein